MADYDQFERLMIRGLSCDQAEVGVIARAMSAIPIDNTPEFAQHFDVARTVAWLNQARRALIAFARPGDKVVHAGFNNLVRKDLDFMPSGRQIEVKSGKAKTDANPGVGPMSWYFGDPDPAVLRAIMAGSRDERWRLRGDQAAVAASKKRTIDALERYLHARFKVGAPAPERLALTVRAMVIGFTTKAAISAYMVRGGSRGPLLLEADAARGLVPYGRSFLPGEQITVASISRGDERVTLTLRGAKSGVTARIYPNWKNHWTHSGIRVKADHWVASPCFHVWFS